MKTKTLGILIASMASVALMGAGFSTWVVSGTIDSADAAPVTVAVGDVADSRVTVTAQLVAEDKPTFLTFDCGGVESAGLIGVQSGSPTEDLSVTVQVTATAGASYNGGAINIGWNVTLPETVTTNNLAVLSDVTYSASSVKNDGKISITPTESGAQASLTFTFGWGSAFCSKNPAKITANDLTTNSITLDDIIDRLEALQTAMTAPSAVTININPIA
ncbi:MAG: hypothetical protein SPI58_00685 [Candidatus Enteromonas sp.]|nr:hypothetical protein [Candidatus Enteromonas sp.]